MSNVHGYYLHHQELIQATLLLRLANGLLGALSGCAGNGMCDYMDQKKFLQVWKHPRHCIIQIKMMLLQAWDERKHSGHCWTWPDWESCHAEAQTIWGWQVQFESWFELFGLGWFSLVWFLMLQFVRKVLVSIHAKFDLSRCLVCPTIEINICSILLIIGIFP